MRYIEGGFFMEFIKKRLKGLCALITAAAVSLSALTVPASAALTDRIQVVVAAAESGNDLRAISYVLVDDSTDNHKFNESHDLVVDAENALKGYSSKAIVFVLSTKAKDFTIPVYGADEKKLFDFTTNCEDKTFPTEQLKEYFSCSLKFKYKYSYSSTPEEAYSIFSGEELWKELETLRKNEETNGGTFSMDNLTLTVECPVIFHYTPNISTNPGYTYNPLDCNELANGKIDYINSRLNDNDFWSVQIIGRDVSNKDCTYAETIKGSDLIKTLKDKAATFHKTYVHLTYIDKIAVVNKISGSSENPDYGEFFSGYSFDSDKLTECTIDNYPVTAYELARKAGIKPDDAAYDAALYTPSSWTVWGGFLNYGSGSVVANKCMKNGKFEKVEDFNFNDANNTDYYNLPILQVHEMELLNVDIPCDEAAGGKLTYTAADHSDFPTKANVTSWVFSYDGKQVNVSSADELWEQIEKIIVTDGKIYDSKLAKLSYTLCSAGHKWSKTYKSDKDGHWKICEVCNAVSKKDAHTPGKLSADHKQTCTTCGYLIKTVPHSYAAAWKSNSTSHWHECSCGDKADLAKHTPDNGTVTVQPTATSAGTMTYSCKVCGYVIETQTIPATGTPSYPNRPSYPTNTPSTPTADTTKAMFTFDWNIQGKKAVLSWNDIPDAESYTVYQYKNGKYVKVKTTEDASVTFKNLKNGKTYKFMVKYTIKGKTYSAGASGKFTGKFYYKPIAEATAGKNRIKLTWEKVPNAEKYAIYKYVDGKAVKLAETTKLSVNIKGLKSDKEYQYIVRAYVDGKWTDMKKSDIVTAKTKA